MKNYLTDYQIEALLSLDEILDPNPFYEAKRELDQAYCDMEEEEGEDFNPDDEKVLSIEDAAQQLDEIGGLTEDLLNAVSNFLHEYGLQPER